MTQTLSTPLRAFAITVVRVPLVATTFSTVLWLGGCGGGADATAAASTTPGADQKPALTYTQGRVEGLGSLVVNGMRFDDSNASITDDAGRSLRPTDLKLGMLVEVLAPIGVDGVGHAAAQAVRHTSEVQGPISALLPSGFVVLGHTVNYNARTVFDDGRSVTLRVGQIVEVHGLRDSQGVIQASMIDIESDTNERHKVIGTVTTVDVALRTATLDGVSFSYASLPSAPTLAVGHRVRAELSPTSSGTGWVATHLQVQHPLALGTGGVSTAHALGQGVDIEGVVTRVETPTRFAVAGVVVDASQALSLPSPLAVGDLLEVEGRWSNGTLLASQVERESHLDIDDPGFDIEGTLTAVDLIAQTLVLHGITVNWRHARFEDGSPQQLVVGRRVDVKGPLSADGNSVEATEIEFD